jgi:anti-sigma-K factor RskA
MTDLPHGNGADDEVMVQYVLGELSPAEAEAFEARMAADAALGDEVRQLRNTLELMPYATVTEPPPALRDAVLEAAQAQVRAKPAPPRAPARPARRVVWSRFAAAAAAVLALALGVDGYRLRRELQLEREVTSMLQEPNVVRSFRLAGTGSAGRAFGAVTLDLDAKKGAVALRGLPVLPAEQVYRLWARVGDKDVPCGDFAAGGDGAVRAQFRVPVESYTAPIARLFVTVEPETPSDHPSGPTVLQSAPA